MTEDDFLVVEDFDVERILPVADALPIVETALSTIANGQAACAPRQNIGTALDTGSEHIMKVWAATAENGAAVRISSAIITTEQIGGRRVANSVDSTHQGYCGLVILFDATTALPIGLIHDGHIGRLSTSATAGVAAKYVAREDAAVLGVLGMGAQARQQLAAIAAVRRISKVRIFAPRQTDAEEFAAEQGNTLGLPIAATADPRDAVSGCDIVILATSATGPVLERAWIDPGTHITATRPSEVPDDLLEHAQRIVSAGTTAAITTFADGAGLVWLQRELRGAAIRPRAVALADVIGGLTIGRATRDDVTVFGAFAGHTPATVLGALGREALCRARTAGVGHALPRRWLLQARPS